MELDKDRWQPRSRDEEEVWVSGGNFVPAERRIREKTKNKINELNVCTVNARSLQDKVPSLIDLFDYANVFATIITETWIKNNFTNIREELLFSNGLDIVSYSRPGLKRGGGVAIVFKPEVAKLEENKFKKDGFEIISTAGRLINDSRVVVIYGLLHASATGSLTMAGRT